MQTFTQASATVLRATLRHHKTGARIEFKALVEKRTFSGYRVAYSHAPRMRPGSGPWFSDALTWADSFDAALTNAKTVAHLIECADDVRGWAEF